jgi:F-type H+-transporting ATPase subunit alpha
MKKVAGRLRLDLAQFRELEAFAQFGSDLDAATQRQLSRGQRTVEILKQGQYVPLPVEDQVMVIFAVTQGFLDDVEVNRIQAWEASFLEFMHSAHKDVGDAIRDEKVMSEETEKELREAIEQHKRLFRTEVAEQVAAVGA